MASNRVCSSPQPYCTALVQDFNPASRIYNLCGPGFLRTMEVLFLNSRVKRLCACSAELRDRLGPQGAPAATAQLASLRAAFCLAEFRYLPGRCSERRGEFRLHLPERSSHRLRGRRTARRGRLPRLVDHTIHPHPEDRLGMRNRKRDDVRHSSSGLCPGLGEPSGRHPRGIAGGQSDEWNTELAERLGVTLKHVNRVVKGAASISADLALALRRSSGRRHRSG